jgi:hypothetical protein
MTRPDTHDWFARATERRRQLAREPSPYPFMRCADCSQEFSWSVGSLRCSACQASRSMRIRRARLRVVA